MIARSVCALTFLGLTPALTASPSEPSCEKLFGSIVNYLNDRKRKEIEAILKSNLRDFLSLANPASRSSVHLVLLPILGPIRVVDEVVQSSPSELWKVPFRVMRKDGGILAGAILN